MPVTFNALITTIAVEYAVYLIIQRKKPLFLLFAAVLINCLTQPPAYFAFNYLINSSFNIPKFIYFILVEIAVFVIEIFLIKLMLHINYKRSVIVSFSANLITALLSFI